MLEYRIEIHSQDLRDLPLWSFTLWTINVIALITISYYVVKKEKKLEVQMRTHGIIKYFVVLRDFFSFVGTLLEV